MSDDVISENLAPYAAVAKEVVDQIGARAETDGNPQVYGHVYGALVGAYVGVVLPLRPLGAADAFLLDVFRSIALSVSGGVQPQRFRDVIKAALSASVHVESVLDAMRAQHAATAPQEPVKPEPAWEGEGDGGDYGQGLTKEEFLSGVGMEHDKPLPGVLPEDHPFKAPVPTVADHGAGVLPDPDVALAAADEDDEARASDEDLLRWVLTPGSDPWGDLLEEPEAGESSKRAMRADVTQAMVQARFDRLHGLLDTSKAPEGVKPEVWEAAKARALPITFGDRGPA